MQSSSMQSSYVLVNDLRVHYFRWGEAGEGPPLLCLHGLASNARIWEKTTPLLAEAGLYGVAPDARGHGLTDKPENDYSFDTIGRELGAFVQALHLEHPILVGHSWGASLAIDYAARFRFGPMAPAGIILVDGGMIQMNQIPGATWESTQQRLTPPPLAGMPVDEFIARLKAWNASWKPDDQALSITLANFEVSQDETISPRLSLDRHMQILRAMWDFPTYERFAQIQCPALLILAKSAPPISADQKPFLEAKRRGVERLQALRPGLQIQWMEDTIHDVPLQRPRELAQSMIEFVGRLAR